MHEVAHLVSGDPHTAKFKHTLLNMGGTLEMYYCPYANAYAKSCHDLHDLTVWEEVKKATIEVKRATIEVKRALIEEVFHWITGR
ncbi:MAG: hypothetical protein KGH64_04355 [Candidatus Micrarchaeota archaeon]|nr:hypothetical protein [Candidatus Micrarchaeota archaeon]